MAKAARNPADSNGLHERTGAPQPRAAEQQMIQNLTGGNRNRRSSLPLRRRARRHAFEGERGGPPEYSSYRLAGTTSTGQFVARSKRSVTLPISMRDKPLRP